jgi:hypothetical protein
MELYEIIDCMYGWFSATKMYLDWDWLFELDSEPEPNSELVETRGICSMSREMTDMV